MFARCLSAPHRFIIGAISALSLCHQRNDPCFIVYNQARLRSPYRHPDPSGRVGYSRVTKCVYVLGRRARGGKQGGVCIGTDRTSMDVGDEYHGPDAVGLMVVWSTDT